jgi:hypothetical protein
MNPCSPISRVATRLSSLHRGQVSQPSPEPVSRTAPPVMMMTTVIARAMNAARRTVTGRGVQRSAMAARGLRIAFGTRPC